MTLKFNTLYLEGISLVLVVIIMLSTFFTLIGYLNLLKIPAIVIGILFGLFYIKSIKSKKVISSNIILIIVLIVLITICFHSYTINAGRDNGGYLNAAILISNTGSYYSNDSILGTLPGFRNVGEELVTYGFLPSYPVYQSFFSFNIHFFYLANGILYFFILFFLYSITEKITSKRNAIIFILLFSTFYTSLWIIRNTFSEILMSFLIWFSVYLLIQENPQKKLWSILPITLSTLVRVDAAIYFIFFIFLYLFINKNNLLKYRKLFVIIIFMISIVFLSVFVIINNNSYSSSHVTEAIWNVKDLLSQLSPSSSSENNIPNIYDEYPYTEYLYIVLNSYNLIAYIPLLCILFFYLMLRYKFIHKEIFLILILFLPAVLFIFRPMITPDHPWFMRRFWVIHIPVIIMMSVYILQKFPLPIRIFYVIFLLISNLVFGRSIPYMRENISLIVVGDISSFVCV